MSRRDTIIVAALINAGLLIILFVSALKNPSSTETLTQAPEISSQPLSESIARADSKTVMGDEVDQVLSQYSKQNPLQPAPVAVLPETPAVETVTPIAAAETPIAPSQNFVDDLNALTKASEQAASQETLAAPAVSSSAPSFVEVKVKKGDVLEKIARSNHTSVQELMKINKLSSTSLKIGQVLKVPGKAIAKSAAPAKAGAQAPAGDSSLKYYTVKSGDNPWTIAVKNHIKVEDLLRLNNMDEARARKLKPGDQIRIR